MPSNFALFTLLLHSPLILIRGISGGPLENDTISSRVFLVLRPILFSIDHLTHKSVSFWILVVIVDTIPSILVWDKHLPRTLLLHQHI